MALSKLEITQSNLWGQISYGFVSNNLMFDKITLTDSSGQNEIVSYDELCKRRLGMGMELISKILGVEIKGIHGNKASAFFCTNVEDYSIENNVMKINMINPVIIAEVLPECKSIEENGIVQHFISFKDFNFGIENVASMSATLKKI